MFLVVIDLAAFKGKFENRLSACYAQVDRFSFNNLADPEYIRDFVPVWFRHCQVR